MAKRIAWTDQARADVRSLDQPAAMKLLEGLARFLATEQGDVKRLKGIEPPELRLRLGNYRIRFNAAIQTSLRGMGRPFAQEHANLGIPQGYLKHLHLSMACTFSLDVHFQQIPLLLIEPREGTLEHKP